MEVILCVLSLRLTAGTWATRGLRKIGPRISWSPARPRNTTEWRFSQIRLPHCATCFRATPLRQTHSASPFSLCRPGPDCDARAIDDQLTRTPDNIDVLAVAVNFNSKRGNIARAIALQRHKIELHPDRVADQFEIGRLLLLNREFDGARRALAVAKEPSEKPPSRSSSSGHFSCKVTTREQCRQRNPWRLLRTSSLRIRSSSVTLRSTASPRTKKRNRTFGNKQRPSSGLRRNTCFSWRC
jgi:hypothetical protein